MTRRPLTAIVTALVLSAAVGACTNPPSTGTPTSTTSRPTPDHVLKDLCQPLVDLFSRDLHAVGVRIRDTHDLTSSIDNGGNCYLDSDTTWVGYVSLSGNATDDPTRKLPEFHPMAGTTAPVWIADGRPRGLVHLVTQSDGWRVAIQINEELIQTPSGRLNMTDEQLRQVAELGIRLDHLR